MRRRLMALALAIAIAAPFSAAADHPLGNIPWPDLLPPRPGVPAPAQPAQPCGAAASPTCVDGVIADMIAAWQPLDDSCDHRAVFALTYLITTQGFRTYLSDQRAGGFFDDEVAIINLDRVFADLYFDAFFGRAVPEAWRIAFTAAQDGRTNAVQDVFLGMNAHIQRDLPVALSRVGLVDGNGASRKPDHNRVNEILSAVLDDIEDELAARYDPTVGLADASPSPVDEVGALEMLKLWREGAWRNAERLSLAKSDAERASIMNEIETYATAWAHVIEAADFSWYATQRDLFCQSARTASIPPAHPTAAR
ncbi:MAG: DUF5995 family protein [Actinomycetota bacterium]